MSGNPVSDEMASMLSSCAVRRPYVERVADIAARTDRRSAEMRDAPEAQLLADLAEGLRRRVSHLVGHDRTRGGRVNLLIAGGALR